MEGTQIGSYRIERTLGSGGFGVVYVGVDVRLGRRAAIKQLLPELSGQHEIVERFFNEAKAAASINHPGIVEIYDVGWHTDGSAYFAMKLLEGDSLGKRLATAGPMPVQLAATIARQVSSALVAAHARGIVHRDLKPDNIMLVRDDEVAIGERATVLDFGIAKLFGDKPASQKTRTGMMMGTPSYMSPEQCRGAGEVDHRTDVYALGCIVFEMLTGRPPFVGEGAGEVLGMHQFVAAPMLRSLRPDVSPDFEAVVMRCLAKHPGERFQHMSELTAALQPFATGGRSMEHPVARPPSVAPLPATIRSSTPPRSEGAWPGAAHAVPSGPPSTLSAGRGEQLRQPGAPSSRRGLAIGAAAVVVIGAGIALVVALGGSRDQHAAAPADAAAIADAPAVARLEVDAAAPVAARLEVDAAAPVGSAGDGGGGGQPALLDGNQALADRKWLAASDAAQSVLAIEPGNADAKRIVDTARSEIKSEVALTKLTDAAHRKDYAGANAALAAIPETSVYRQPAKIAFDELVAEYIQVVSKQARELVATKKCKNLSALARQAGAVSAAARSAVEAIKCSTDDSAPPPPPPPPRTPCDFDSLARAGDDAASRGTYAAAVASYDKALKCRPDAQVLMKAFMSACNMRNAAKAKVYFKQLPPAKQGQLSQICIRNGIELP